jgi:hypothetical protein
MTSFPRTDPNQPARTAVQRGVGLEQDDGDRGWASAELTWVGDIGGSGESSGAWSSGGDEEGDGRGEEERHWWVWPSWPSLGAVAGCACEREG